MNQFEQLTEPRIKASEITLHIDTDNDNDYNSAEDLYSHAMPLVKIRNTLIHTADLVSFTLSVGNAMMPSVRLTFNDTIGTFSDQDYPIQNDILTCVIRNKYDDESTPIHTDFLITDIKKVGTLVIVGAVMLIPAIFDIGAKVFDATSSKDALIELCDTLGLGFVTNTSASDSKQIVQRNISNFNCIKSILNKFVAEGTSFKCYIGLDYNMYLVDLSKNYDYSPTARKVSTNWANGDELDEAVDIKLSNYQGLIEGNPFRIDEWSPINASTAIRFNRSSAVKQHIAIKSYTDRAVSDTEHESLIADKSTDAKLDLVSSFNDIQQVPFSYSDDDDGEDLDLDHIAASHNSVMSALFNNVNKIKTSIGVHSTMYYPGDVLPVDIYNQETVQASPIDNDSNAEESDNEPVTSRNAQTLSTQWSGNYMIDSVTYTLRDNHTILTSLQLSKRYFGIQYVTADQTI